VIGTTSGGTKEYIEDGESGILVAAKDSAALTDALAKLIASPSERARLGANARERVLRCFQRSEIARQTLELYKEAQTSFAQNKSSPQYRRNPDRLLADADSLLCAFHATIHDLLYSFSWRYRMAYWRHLIRKRPRLFLAKLALLLCQKTSSILPFKMPQLTSTMIWLENQIIAKQTRQIPATKLLTATSENQI
jgi:hypothetical protein